MRSERAYWRTANTTSYYRKSYTQVSTVWNATISIQYLDAQKTRGVS